MPRKLPQNLKSVFTQPVWGVAFYALIAQLAEHIHGKDEVISSILIEGCMTTRGWSYKNYLFVKRAWANPTLDFREVNYGSEENSSGINCFAMY